MSKLNTIGKMQLAVGDYIALDTPAQDIDTPDSTVWMRITEVVFEDGCRGYRTVYPDGEPRRGTVRANTVGRFKLATDYARDEKNMETLGVVQTTPTNETIGHEWHCFCLKCERRVLIGREILDIQQREFEARKARLAA